MKDKKINLAGIALFVVLIILSICSIFIKNIKFIIMINYLSIPVLILSMLISANKYFDGIFSKLNNEFKTTAKLYFSYEDLLKKQKKFIEEEIENGGEIYKDISETAIITQILCVQSGFMLEKKKKYEKLRQVFFWILLVPICAILLLLTLCGFVDLPYINLYFLNLFSLDVLVADWVLIDYISSWTYNKIAAKLLKIEEEIKDKGLEYEI